MTQVCPSCNSALDPAHAPIARVRAARVVAYCSAKCADAGDTSAVGVDVVRETEEGEGKKNKETLSSVQKTKAVAAAAKAADKPALESKRPDSSADSGTQGIRREEMPDVVPVSESPDSVNTGTRRMSASLRKRVLWASGVIMFGSMGIAALQTLSPGSPSSVSASQSPKREPIQGDVALSTATPMQVASDSISAEKPTKKDTATDSLSDSQLRAAAIVELATQLEEGTPRFQRVAGLALARISHPQALEALARLLKTEDSDLARIDIAYGLARGGDALGRAYLVSELGSKRRDVRIDAGRRLAQLKDNAGTKALTNMLKVRSHRLGAASVLALLGDEAGLGILRETLSSPKSSEENRMRAAVGLGLSGEASVKGDLIAILEGERFVVDAAGALAVLGEASAVPALKRQLELSSMCVSAAESLASMQVEVDLRGLASVLLTSNELGRTAAAEAILILTHDQEAITEE